MNSPIICAGFHRSGTSLASQIIHLSGVPYAIEPMGGSISKPDGHFGDVQITRIHDQLLAKSGTSWKYFGECQIANKLMAIQRIKAYSNCRMKMDGPLWLMKDPRATLFLEEWGSALSGKANFVLMFRHWGLCIQSLLKRSSRYMLSQLGEKGLINDNLTFWKDIELSARMWLAYNKCIIAYYKLNSAKCLLVPQSSLLDGYDLIENVNSKFHLNLTTLKESPVKLGYSSESIESIIFDSLSINLIDELDKTFIELCKLANVNTPAIEKTQSTNTNTTESIRLKLQSNQEKGLEPPKPIAQDITRLKKSMKSGDLELILNNFKELKLYQNITYTQSLAPLLRDLLDLYPFNFDLQELAGRIYLFLGQPQKSEEHLFKALSLNGNPPYLRMLIADSYKLRFNFDLAEHYYLNAHYKNPKNPQFLIKLGELNTLKKEYASAINFYQKALELNEQDWIKCKISDVVNLDQGVASAINTINDFLSQKKSQILTEKLISFDFFSDSELAMTSFTRSIRNNVKPDLISNFFGIVANNNISETGLNNLAYWLSKQMLSFFSESEVEKLLSPERKLLLENSNRAYPILNKQNVKTIRPISFIVIKFSNEIDYNFYRSNDVRSPWNQIIEVDNTANLYYENLNRAIASGVSKANHSIIAIIHEDVLLVDNWQLNFEHSLSELERIDPDWGMLGAVGWDENGSLVGHWSDPHQYNNTFVNKDSWAEVVKLDEQLLVFNRNRLPDFDISLPGIHHLGADFRNQLINKGFKTYAINAPTIHKYADANGKLIQNKDGSPKIIDRDSRTYLADKSICDRYIQKKWPNNEIPKCIPLENFDLGEVSIEKLEQLESPIVLISRGGSGSRLCSLLAQDVGIFLGKEVSISGDATDLVSAVYQGVITKYQCFAEWQKQEIAPRLRKAALDVIASESDDLSWGFKLPESLFLLNEIQEAFPKAKFIHFIRDPITTTLRRTHMTARLDNHIGRISLPLAYDFLSIPRANILTDSPALHMARTTMHQLEVALDFFDGINKNKYLEVRYEDVLSNPAKEVENLSNWLDLNVVSNKLESSIDIKRAVSPNVAYSSEEEGQVREILFSIRKKLGYLDT